jgi:hypothetical protein
MKRLLFIFALLTAPCAVAQEPSPGVPATAPRTIQAQNADTSIETFTGFIRMNWTGSGCTASNSSGVPTINCSGGFGSLPTSVAARSELVSNGVSQAPVYQTKSVLNVRDYGVTCSGTTDDTTAMQNAINAACNTGGRGKTLMLPNSCTVKLTSALNVTKCSGITLDGGQSQGQATIGAAGGEGSGNAALLWYGPGRGTVLEINQTRDSVFKNLTVFANASSYKASGANTGILIDEIAPITNIVTNNHFDNIQVVNYAANSSFIGIDICPTAPGNCESQNFDRLFITCGGGTPTSTSNGIGIQYYSGEPFYEYLHWYEATGCSEAIAEYSANILDIDGGLMSGNYTDLFLGGGRNVSYRHVRSESAIAQIVIGTSSGFPGHDLTVEENSFAGLTNNTTTISYPFSVTGGIIRLIKNDWDANSTVTPFGPTGSGAFVGVLDSEDNTYPNTANCIATAFASSGVMYSSLNDQPTGGTCNYGSMHLGRPIGSLRIDPTAFDNLPTCAPGTQGTLKPVSDSTTNAWGATITGGGSHRVLAYCNGTNWTVAAK